MNTYPHRLLVIIMLAAIVCMSLAVKGYSQSIPNDLLFNPKHEVIPPSVHGRCQTAMEMVSLLRMQADYKGDGLTVIDSEYAAHSVCKYLGQVPYGSVKAIFFPTNGQCHYVICSIGVGNTCWQRQKVCPDYSEPLATLPPEIPDEMPVEPKKKRKRMP